MEKIISLESWKQFLEAVLTWSANNLPMILLIIALFFILKKVVRSLLYRFEQRIVKRYQDSGDLEGQKRISTLSKLFKSIVFVAMNVVVVLILLSQVGINIGPLLAGAGIAGLAVGFGAQELVRDVISGFFIILEDQIRVGDVVMINGVGGLVEKIEVRTITLRDLSGTVHIFQNGKINSLSNMTKEWSARVFDIGVAYKENTENVTRVVKEVADELKKDPAFSEKILEPIEILGLDQFGASEVIIKARFKTKPGDQWSIGREFNKRLKQAFDRENIEIPFPHRTIYFGDQEDPAKLARKGS